MNWKNVEIMQNKFKILAHASNEAFSRRCWRAFIPVIVSASMHYHVVRPSVRRNVCPWSLCLFLWQFSPVFQIQKKLLLLFKKAQT